MSFKNNTINGKNLLTDFGFIIQRGLGALLAMPERKETLKNDWAEQNGTEEILDAPKWKDNDVTLNCCILAENDTQYWQYRDALWAELSTPGTQALYIDDHGKTYTVVYRKSANWQKTSKRLKGVNKVMVKFDLSFTIKF